MTSRGLERRAIRRGDCDRARCPDLQDAVATRRLVAFLRRICEADKK